MEESSEQNVRLLDVLARALHVKDARLYATLAAIALAEAQRTDQLHAALLSRASQQVNMKLATVARHLAETGELLP
jgi:hypothetical protein